jgi:hypothetical protein
MTWHPTTTPARPGCAPAERCVSHSLPDGGFGIPRPLVRAVLGTRVVLSIRNNLLTIGETRDFRFTPHHVGPLMLRIYDLDNNRLLIGATRIEVRAH